MATEVKRGNAYKKLSAGGPAAVIQSPARLVRLIVTTSPTAVSTFYNNAAGDGSGDVVHIIPANTAVGTIYELDFPCTAGIAATIGTAGVVNCVFSQHS